MVASPAFIPPSPEVVDFHAGIRPLLILAPCGQGRVEGLPLTARMKNVTWITRQGWVGMKPGLTKAE